MSSIYQSGRYLELTRTWHREDSLWKAKKIASVLDGNALVPRRVAEIGCGAGGILLALQEMQQFERVAFAGYDISPQAIELAKAYERPGLEFHNIDVVEYGVHQRFDVALIIDVFEHVEDYFGFLRKVKDISEYKMFHIPLEMHVSSVLRDSFAQARDRIGHIHYFSAGTALATLRDTGYEIVDSIYTAPAVETFSNHRSLRRAVANAARWPLARLSVPLAARILGGYSLMVLAK